MTTTKLTLSVDKELIARAKRLAAEQHTSLSAMISRLLRANLANHAAADTLSDKANRGTSRFGAADRVPAGPLTRQAAGMIRLPAGKNDRVLLEEALAAKYERRR
ncbi:MAG: DUF6364 family protein [Planctomycetota bacterium]